MSHLVATLVERHLETCQKCGLEVSTYARVKAAPARGDGNGGAAYGEALERLMRFVQRLTGPEGPST